MPLSVAACMGDDVGSEARELGVERAITSCTLE